LFKVAACNPPALHVIQNHLNRIGQWGREEGERLFPEKDLPAGNQQYYTPKYDKIWYNDRILGGIVMKTEELKIKYPSGFELAVHMTKEEMEQHIRLMAALKMFELGKITSGKAAELAGMSRAEFLEACGRYRISVLNYPDEEVGEEIKKDFETAKKMSSV
jgi:predicted HTH domain antitoxin